MFHPTNPVTMKRSVFHHLIAVLALGVGLLSGGCSPTTATDPRPTSGNAVVDAIHSRRSIRRYTPRRIARDTLQRLLECGSMAPNGQGRESWQVRVLDDPQLLGHLDSLYDAAMRRSPEAPKLRAAYGAPVVLFVAYDTTYDLSQVDCGLWGGNVQLAAHSLGLGSCCLGGLTRLLNSPAGGPFLGRLQLPPTHRLLYAIALGYPDESPEPKPRDLTKIRFVE